MLDERDQKKFDVLARILDQELEAQFGVKRPHQTPEDRHTFAVLLADAVWDRFSLTDRFPVN